MSLTNFSLPFGGIASPNWAVTPSPIQPFQTHHTNSGNTLLYGPGGHQESDDTPPAGVTRQEYFKNNPYAPPAQNHQFQFGTNVNTQHKGGNAYLPPVAPPPPKARNPYENHQRTQTQTTTTQFTTSHYSGGQPPSGSYLPPQAPPQARTYGEGSYMGQQQQQPQPIRPQPQQFLNGYNSQTRPLTNTPPAPDPAALGGAQYGQPVPAPAGTPAADKDNNSPALDGDGLYPERAPGFTRVQAGQGSRTQVHAVLDYDAEEGEEDYYDEDDEGTPVGKDGKKSMPTVTPIQGPIFVKNGTVPVVPLFSYPTINNGSFVQIPIWWTALSVALGLDIRGDLIKGVPCIKRYHQLFCPTAGNSYPIDKIERFIDDNKALMRRMYGDFEMNMDKTGPLQQTKRTRRFIDEPDLFIPPGAFPANPPDGREQEHGGETGESYFGKLRDKRQAGSNANSKPPPFPRGGPADTLGNIGGSTGRMDACESKIEIVTPYWASNSAGKIRAIVNTQHFEQAIHQEICTKLQTNRCDDDCGCEQKYKWHRLLAYDPDNDCKGIFMDWFLFPSCCVCRCNP